MLLVELSDTQLVSATIHNILNGGRMRYTRQFLCLQKSFGDLYLSTWLRWLKKYYILHGKGPIPKLILDLKRLDGDKFRGLPEYRSGQVVASKDPRRESMRRFCADRRGREPAPLFWHLKTGILKHYQDPNYKYIESGGRRGSSATS